MCSVADGAACPARSLAHFAIALVVATFAAALNVAVALALLLAKHPHRPAPSQIVVPSSWASSEVLVPVVRVGAC